MDLKLIKQEVKKEQVCPSCNTKMDLYNYLFSLQSGVCTKCADDLRTDHVLADVNEQKKREALEAQGGSDEQ